MNQQIATTTRLELSPAQLRRRCDPAGLGFKTTAELTPADGFIGQRRASEALTFGLAIRERGFNVFVAGAPGTGKTTAVRTFLERAARARPTPSDWCYVHNFDDASRPRALRLPPGQARVLRDGVRKLVQAARREIPRVFESEEYIARREAIVGELNKQRERGFGELASEAQRLSLVLQPTPVGFAILPVMGGRPLNEEQLANLRPEMRELIDRNREQLEVQLRAFLKEMRSVERTTREQLEAQDREVALNAVGGLVDDLTDDYQDQPEVSAYLQNVREGILADIMLFRGHPLPTDGSPAQPTNPEDPRELVHERAFRKYDINVIVDHHATSGAPVEMETNPTHPNLIGRVEREALLGALVTDFTLIAPGALHRANGGYLVLRIEELLRAPLAWDGLKRSLREGAVQLEDLNEALGLTSTRGLRPDPIPLDVKVFLLGDPGIYQLLYRFDPDMHDLFKVRADFDTELDRTPETEATYAAFLAGCARVHGRPVNSEAVALLVEESGRQVADQRKLTARLGWLSDLAREANYWAQTEGHDEVEVEHVRRAIAQRVERASLLPERLREMVARGILVVKPEGEAVGQIHGLAVVGVADAPFGISARITATVGAGREGLLDIERQAELGGRIHSKGVLILGGYLSDRYAQDKPLALSARLTFEQSYEEVEGDSASLAELLALLSQLADVPIHQGIAVTGSVNQHGEVQAVGGVNQKIEGFFDICKLSGLTGQQGVMLPATNIEHLMLREDLVAAVAEGRFHIYAARTVDEALEVVTGRPSAEIHAAVNARVRALAELLNEFGAPPRSSHDGLGTGSAPPPTTEQA